MKPSDRRALCSLVLLALASPGCGLDHDRQMVFTAPRTPSARVIAKDGAGAKAPSVAKQVPPASPLPPSNGIDVPILTPE